jgi:alkylation response protein AidB-like acyl-CoA dehydrogenase
MNFDRSSDQQLLVETAASFVRKESPVERLRRMREDPTGYSRELWKRMGELGWLGIMFPEPWGYGGTFVDAALLLEELGSTLVPEPFIPSVVLAGTAILRAGSDEQREKLLGPLVAGDITLALAHAERNGRYETSRVATRAEKTDSGYRLRGKKVFVLNGHAADVILISARTSGGEADAVGVSLFFIDRETKGLVIRPIKTMDGQRAAEIELDGVEVTADRLLGPEGGAAALLEELMDYGAAAACAEGVGNMRAVLQMTLDYLRTREQFGVKIGTFQALQHRAVDMFIESELGKSTSIMAAIKVDSKDEIERKTAVSAAKVQLAVSGRFVTQQAIQLHGGIGITDEHDIGLYFKRMHVLNSLFGDEEHHLARFSSLPTFTEGIEGAGAASMG